MGKNDLKTIAVIDGNSWMHRAYHAVPPFIKMQDGTPTNAVHGFMNMFLSFMGKAQVDGVVCAFDAGIPQFRLAAVAEYKAQRKPMDNELRVQFPIIEDVLAAMSIPVLKVDGWEGDDVLGTIARMCEEQNMCSLLVTGDKDANQLASDKTKIVNMHKGVSEVAILGPDEVFEKYGVRVDQFIDYLALMGDSSDNIPGVPGIGPKSATKLLQDFGDLEGIYANLDKLKGKQRQNVKENKDSAYISRQAATISTDVPLNLDLASVAFPSFDTQTVVEAFTRYSLKNSLEGVLSFAGEDLPEEVQESSIDNNADAKTDASSASDGKPPRYIEPIADYKFEDFITGDEALDFSNELIDGDKQFAVAVDELMPAPPMQTSLFDTLDSVEEDCQFIAAFSDTKKTAIIEGSQAVSLITKLVKASSTKQFVVENSKPIYKELFPHDNTADTLISESELFSADLFDLSLVAYILNSSKDAYTATDIYSQFAGETLPNVQRHEEPKTRKRDENYIRIKNDNKRLRLARRAALSCVLIGPAKKLLKQCNGAEIYEKIEKPLTPILVAMERVGAKIDVSQLSELSKLTSIEIDELTKQIYSFAGHEFNIDSPRQLGVVMFDELQMPVIKKTRTGYSTAAEVLEELSANFELPKLILRYREYSKIKSTYIDALPSLVGEDSLIHTTFHQRKTTTGRLSSSDPNIQNIPTRSEFGAKIRECFLPLHPGEVFLTADYSQIELRMLAHLSGDKGLIDAFNSGADFHSATAASVFGVNVNDVTSTQRSRAKAVNFGIVYGQQAFGLSKSLGIEMVEAKDIIDRYFLTYPRVRSYLDEIVAKATQRGYAETLFGRRRYIPELAMGGRLKAFGARTAMNHPMQGSAADVIKLAMINAKSAVSKAGLNARCMMQVHDELDFSCPSDEVKKLSAIVKNAMEHTVELSVPLIVDIATGHNWGEAK